MVTIRGDQPVSEAARLMSEARISALPVVDGDELGIVTTTDVLEHVLLALR